MVTSSRGCQHRRFDVAGVSEVPDDDPPVGPDHDPGDGGVLQADAEPGFGRKLQQRSRAFESWLCSKM